MDQPPPAHKMPFKEFVALMALQISLMALAIDSILPALSRIGKDLEVAQMNHVQFMISILFVGFTCGQVIYGPISDSFGRKRTIYIGLVLFITGCLLSIFAQSFEMMLVGRFLQGFGGAAPRVISMAISRDLYHGREMARVMSIIMSVFVLTPVLAPTLGQVMLFILPWHFIFVFLILVAVIVFIWLSTRLEETLSPENHRTFCIRTILAGFKEALRHPTTLGYAVCTGLIFAGFIGYLTSAQQIFQEYYGVGELFPLYFAISALSIAAASVVNSKIVRQIGMRKICHYALIAIMGMSFVFLGLYGGLGVSIPLWGFMMYTPVLFFCFGLIFGNMNAIAMEPMGHLAGIAAAVVGALSSAISVSVGTLIGQSYNGTLFPMVMGFLILSMISFSLQLLLNKKGY